ncbi:MAG: hypothetical protein ACPG06_00715 [Alphaproteobacteria bacterium]
MEMYRKSFMAMSVTLALMICAPSEMFYADSGNPMVAQCVETTCTTMDAPQVIAASETTINEVATA